MKDIPEISRGKKKKCLAQEMIERKLRKITETEKNEL